MDLVLMGAAGLLLIALAGLDQISGWLFLLGLLLIGAALLLFWWRGRQVGDSEKHADKENEQLLKRAYAQSQENLKRSIHGDAHE